MKYKKAKDAKIPQNFDLGRLVICWTLKFYGKNYFDSRLASYSFKNMENTKQGVCVKESGMYHGVGGYTSGCQGQNSDLLFSIFVLYRGCQSQFSDFWTYLEVL